MALDSFDYENIGGICSIELFDIADVVIDTDAELTATASVKIYFSSESANYTQKQKRGTGGNYFEGKLSFTVPRIRQEVINYINAKISTYFIIMLEDHNGIKRKVGKKSKPFQLITDNSTGRTSSARNETNFEFSGNMLRPANEFDYTPEILTTTTIMYQSLSINLIANTALNYQMPLDMDLSSLIAQFYLASGEQTEVAITAINNTTKVITLFAQESVTVKMNAITKAN